jgi:dTDP-3-amino-2,3,6-trideoxy-4-keto-D-glucose/dTDP-3-amino-3,4,6-trideoxy-alpha-D-glucose/dTDP-2,6-dideoxy-D-kanosamine transaminase
MTIKVWDYLKEYEREKDEIDRAVHKVFSSGRLIQGDSVRNFEERFAKYCGVRYGVGVNSGTDALFLALKALDIGPGDEVLTVANTAVPTVSAIVASGATPRFVDIDPGTYLMDTDRLESAITPKTKAIIPVHLFGQCVNMEAVAEAARKHGLRVVEDCAQAHGATFRGKKAGSFGDLAAFSFYPTKVLGAYGDGGMILSDNNDLQGRARRLRTYGMEDVYYALEQGYNSRLDEVQAEILSGKLGHIEDYINRRRFLAGRYRELLKGTSLVLPEEVPGNRHVYHLFVCRHPRREAIIPELRKRDITVGIHYPWPVHLMPAYTSLGYKSGELPRTEAAAKEVFSLPLYPTLSEEEQDRVCSALREISAGLT